MTTSLSGFSPGCASAQASRAAAMSGRACSLAWPDFFERQTMAAEEAVHRRGGEAFAMLPLQPFRDLGQSDVGQSDVGQSDVGQSDVGVVSTNARIAAPQASIRPDRVSPPCASGATDPVSSHRHFTAADGAIPKRAAAARQLMPASIAAITRSLRSRDSGSSCRLASITSLNGESQTRPLANPTRFHHVEKYSRVRTH